MTKNQQELIDRMNMISLLKWLSYWGAIIDSLIAIITFTFYKTNIQMYLIKKSAQLRYRKMTQ